MVRPIQSIIHALNDPRFKFRTATGIANQTGLSPRAVEQAIGETHGVINSEPANDGGTLYTLHAIDGE